LLDGLHWTETSEGERNFIREMVMVNVVGGALFAHAFAGHDAVASDPSVVTTAGIQQPLLRGLYPVATGVGTFVYPEDPMAIESHAHQRRMPRGPHILSSAGGDVVHGFVKVVWTCVAPTLVKEELRADCVLRADVKQSVFASKNIETSCAESSIVAGLIRAGVDGVPTEAGFVGRIYVDPRLVL